jgi:hypothetical protein
MSNVIHRPFADGALDGAVDVFMTAMADLSARNGLRFPPPPRGPIARGYGHVARTGIFHVAEVEGRIGAFACAIVRGSR